MPKGEIEMKKRKVLVALVMIVAMLITGCEKEEKIESVNPLLGKWSGTLDYTESFTNVMVAENENIEKFIRFENLTFSFVFEFSEEKVALHVDKTSATQFVANAEVGIANMIDAMAAEEATKNGITVDAVFEGMGVSRDAYVADTLKNMNLEVMVNALVEALELQGAYEADEKNIVVVYDDKTYEAMEYDLKGNELTIGISDGSNEFPIKCTKAE
jgi:PBP1b-binding outer membrane lipoprotein LpoB